MKPGVRRSFRGNPCNNQKARTFARAARQRPSNGKAACLSMNSREFPSVPAPRGLGACRPRCYLAPRPCIRVRAEPRGEVAEWSIAPHSKCGVPATVPGVRIPPSPPFIQEDRHFSQFPDIARLAASERRKRPRRSPATGVCRPRKAAPVDLRRSGWGARKRPASRRGSRPQAFRASPEIRSGSPAGACCGPSGRTLSAGPRKGKLL